MIKKITTLPGDGIGPEIVESGKAVLQVIADLYGHQFEFQEGLIGGAAIDATGVPLPDETIERCQSSDACLLGAVGGPKWDQQPPHLRPEKGLLAIRQALNLYANLRPVQALDALIEESTLKPEVVSGVDVLIVRELTGGIYFGEPRERRTIDGEEGVVDTLVYKKSEIERLLHRAFQFAEIRGKHVTSVDKANVLESSRMWRECANEVATHYPSVTLEHMLVDNAAMQLIRQPKQFDVLVTENLFGDILSDEASMITGSLGMLPSASLNGTAFGLYEPVHGSAPDIAGLNQANPLATIASTAMLLRYSFGLLEEAHCIEQAINQVLLKGYRTADLTNANAISTEEMTKAVIKEIKVAIHS
ncbi:MULTISPECIES: 3-isopropylmalate dehydrogenase [Bacillaceae]|uniref:3-isopropylmalate dehydrogenase n=1 Tax=Alkalicoccobacillus plakortidis TaxID=444060 RepID=A0A9D5DNV6_9BACI|nr:MULTISPECIES: 3-isopropylmalate dehydrogenase [Bacillaceae]KQL57565.1 3-isopropylmalate dehydrogenase [Alkalicoccobacillus plakortidis]